MSVFFLKRAAVRLYIVWPAENVGPTRFEMRLLMTPCIDLSFTLSAISALPCRLRITTTRHAFTLRLSMEIASRFCVRCSTPTPSTRCLKCGTHGGTSSSFLRWDDRHRLPRPRLTPLEVAKSEFRPLFSHFHEERRPASSASHATVRPLHNSGSNMSLSTLTPRAYSAAHSPPPDDEVSPSAFEKLLDTLNSISMDLTLPPGFTSSDAALDRFDARLRDASSVSQDAISQLYSRLDEAREEAVHARELWTGADASLDTVSQAVEEKLTSGSFIAREPGAEDSSHESVATRHSSSDTDGDVPTTPGFATELLILDSSENDGILLKPWPRARDSEDTANHSMTQESEPANSIAHLRSHKSMSDLRQLTPPPTQDEIGATSNPVRRARADTLTDIGTRGGRSRQLLESGAEGEGKRARFKAWLRRTFLPERPPRSPVHNVEEPPSSLTTLVEKDESVTVSNSPLHPSYRVLATVGKDLARIDECISNVRPSIILVTHCLTDLVW